MPSALDLNGVSPTSEGCSVDGLAARAKPVPRHPAIKKLKETFPVGGPTSSVGATSIPIPTYGVSATSAPMPTGGVGPASTVGATSIPIPTYGGGWCTSSVRATSTPKPIGGVGPASTVGAASRPVPVSQAKELEEDSLIADLHDKLFLDKQDILIAGLHGKWFLDKRFLVEEAEKEEAERRDRQAQGLAAQADFEEEDVIAEEVQQLRESVSRKREELKERERLKTEAENALRQAERSLEQYEREVKDSWWYSSRSEDQWQGVDQDVKPDLNAVKRWLTENGSNGSRGGKPSGIDLPLGNAPPPQLGDPVESSTNADLLSHSRDSAPATKAGVASGKPSGIDLPLGSAPPLQPGDQVRSSTNADLLSHSRDPGPVMKAGVAGHEGGSDGKPDVLYVPPDNVRPHPLGDPAYIDIHPPDPEPTTKAGDASGKPSGLDLLLGDAPPRQLDDPVEISTLLPQSRDSAATTKAGVAGHEEGSDGKPDVLYVPPDNVRPQPLGDPAYINIHRPDPEPTTKAGDAGDEPWVLPINYDDEQDLDRWLQRRQARETGICPIREEQPGLRSPSMQAFANLPNSEIKAGGTSTLVGNTVAELAPQASYVPTGTVGQSGGVRTDVEEDFPTNIGSQNHFSGQCRVCHYGPGKCKDGDKCEFCHVCTKSRKGMKQRKVEKKRQENYEALRKANQELAAKAFETFDETRRHFLVALDKLVADLREKCKKAPQAEPAVRCLTDVEKEMRKIELLVYNFSKADKEEEF